MKWLRSFCWCLVILSSPEFLLSQQQLFPWNKQNPQAQSNPDSLYSYRGVLLRDIFFATPQFGCAVGERGNIIVTRDGGTTWTASPPAMTGDFFDVFFLNAQRGWALIDRGRGGLVTTRDGGTTWTIASRDAIGQTVFFIDEQNGWIATGSNSILSTKDGGTSWTRNTLPTPNAIIDVFFTTALNGWAVGRNGVYATRDGGATWTEQYTSDVYVKRIQFISSQRGVAIGAQGLFLSTTNGGTSWTRGRIPLVDSTSEVDYVKFFDANNGIAADEDMRYYATSNGGTTWTLLSQIQSNGFSSDTYFINATTGFSITTSISQADDLNGVFSVIWKTTDGGKTWQQLRTDNVVPIRDVSFFDTQNAVFVSEYCMGNTKNGGALWNIGYLEPDTSVARWAQFYAAVSMVSPSLAFAASDYGRIGRTDNGGVTWKALSLTEPRGDDSLVAIQFINDQIGWVTGIRHGYNSGTPNTNRIYRTTNGGKTWQLQTPTNGVVGAQNLTLNSIQMLNASNGWVVGNGGIILRTTNGGTTWTRMTSPTTNNLNGVFFANALQGWAVGGTSESALIIQTSDGGTTWRRQLAPADVPLRSVAFVNALQGWAVGDKGTILATRNGGATWEVQDSRTTDNLWRVRFLSSARGTIVGEYGTILSTQNGGFTPQARITPTLLNFDTVSVRDNKPLTVNVSAENMLEGLTITAPTGFVLDYGNQRNQGQIILSPDAQASTQAAITVRFSPSQDGRITSTLRVTSAFINSTIALTGIGINRPVLRFSPQILSFGGILVGQTTTANLTVKNEGNTTGTISYQIFPQDTSRNQIFRTPTFVRVPELAPNETVNFPITFAPKTLGDIDAVLLVRALQGRYDTTYSIRLTGTGLQAAVRTSSAALEFGETSLGQETTATLGITSVGNIPLSVRQITVSPSNTFVIRTNPEQYQNIILKPTESLALSLGFIPTTLGFTRATITITSDAGTERVVVIGNGVPLLAPPTLVSPFNGRINTPVSAVFLWQNVGNAIFYDVQISRDSTFRTIDVEQQSIRSLAFSPSTDLLNNAVYYWRVKSRTLTAVSEWSRPFVFETIRPLQRIRNSPETVQVSGFVGQSNRNAFTLRSISRTTISRAFWLTGSDSAFSIRQDQFPLELRSNVTEFLTFDFKPSKVSSVLQGILVLISPLDTHKVQIFGEGLERDSTAVYTKVSIQTDRTNANVGDTLKIRVMLTESRNLDTLRNRGKAQTFSALLKVRNETVLAAAPILTYPQDLSNNIFLGNGGKTIELRDIPRQTGMKTGVLAEIPARALLGNAPSTVVEFLTFQWNDAAEQRIVQSVVDSSVALVTCMAGGPRFIAVGNGNMLTAITPNPASQQASVKFNLLETGQTELFLVNVLGQRVRSFFSTEKEYGEYHETLDLTGLPDGIYTLILQTPSGSLQQRIGVLK